MFVLDHGARHHESECVVIGIPRQACFRRKTVEFVDIKARFSFILIFTFAGVIIFLRNYLSSAVDFDARA